MQHLSPCNNSWYARAYPRVKNVTFVNFKVIIMSDENHFIDPFKQKAVPILHYCARE